MGVRSYQLNEDVGGGCDWGNMGLVASSTNFPTASERGRQNTVELRKSLPPFLGPRLAEC